MAVITVKVEDKEGTVKKLAAGYITRDLSRDGMWYNTNASEITSVPATLSLANKDWVIWERNEWVKIKFEPSSSESDGQGFGAVPSVGEWEVSTVTGTVYIIRAADIVSTDTRTDIYANSNRVAASSGDKLFGGDAILCAAASSSFIVKITCPKRLPYISMPAVSSVIPQ